MSFPPSEIVFVTHRKTYEALSPALRELADIAIARGEIRIQDEDEGHGS